jgi:hypothetical protein
MVFSSKTGFAIWILFSEAGLPPWMANLSMVMYIASLLLKVVGAVGTTYRLIGV